MNFGMKYAPCARLNCSTPSWPPIQHVHYNCALLTCSPAHILPLCHKCTRKIARISTATISEMTLMVFQARILHCKATLGCGQTTCDEFLYETCPRCRINRSASWRYNCVHYNYTTITSTKQQQQQQQQQQQRQQQQQQPERSRRSNLPCLTAVLCNKADALFSRDNMRWDKPEMRGCVMGWHITTKQ